MFTHSRHAGLLHAPHISVREGSNDFGMRMEGPVTDHLTSPRVSIEHRCKAEINACGPELRCHQPPACCCKLQGLMTVIIEDLPKNSTGGQLAKSKAEPLHPPALLIHRY